MRQKPVRQIIFLLSFLGFARSAAWSAPCPLATADAFDAKFHRYTTVATTAAEMRYATETEPGSKIVEGVQELGLAVDRPSKFSAPVRIQISVRRTDSESWTDLCDTAWNQDVEKNSLLVLESPFPGKNF